MMHCPHLSSDNMCKVATGLAECHVKTSPAACNACQNETNPRAINVVTIGMALVNRKRRRKNTSQLQTMLASYLPEQRVSPATLKITDYRPGPGNELKNMLAWFAKPSQTCNCETRVDTMNDWGAEGCLKNIDTITDWLLEEAELRGMPHGKFTRVIAKSLVQTAVRKFQRKFPDGAPEPNDDEDGD